MEREKSAQDVHKLIIRSLPRATSRHGKRRGNSKHVGALPQETQREEEEISARKCGKFDTKWHMNDEHGASKRNSVLLVLLTKKQMVPIHKDEIIEKNEDHQVRKVSKYESKY